MGHDIILNPCTVFWRLVNKKWTTRTIVVVFFVISGIFVREIYENVIIGGSLHATNFNTNNGIPLNCYKGNLTKKCTNVTYTGIYNPTDLSSATSCPDYFLWIHQDLRPWKETGITREMIEGGKVHAHIRLVILKGKAYVEKYGRPFQTRDVFTLWGILQLLRLYPGKIPDLELMFSCGDKNVIKKSNYQGVNATLPLPPVFHYCGREDSWDIVFPDWTFWGWAEVNIRPWESILESIQEGNKKIKWKDRVPYAFWKGNPQVAPIRNDLMKCNASANNNWKVHLFNQDWSKESKEGYKDSKLEDQCHYRYKIYIEGNAWSVSEKYILACDSMTLLINPEYYDFFIRSMVPMQHYWPIGPTNMCKDLKFAVEWGNNQTYKAQEIGKASTEYLRKNVNMKYVYDYMFHLLSEYSKLLKFKPKIPRGAKEYCPEKLVCSKNDLTEKFMMESIVKSPSNKYICNMSPFDPQTFEEFLKRKNKIKKQVEVWEDEHKLA